MAAKKVSAKNTSKPAPKSAKKNVAKSPQKAAAVKAAPAASKKNIVAKVAPPVMLPPTALSGKKSHKPKPEKKASKKTPAKKEEAIPEEGGSADWLELQKQFKGAKPVPYAMTEDFPAKTVILHKVLGIGYVIKSVNSRIDVIFKDGQKTLITNYKK